jgi:hypothetical protein
LLYILTNTSKGDFFGIKFFVMGFVAAADNASNGERGSTTI